VRVRGREGVNTVVREEGGEGEVRGDAAATSVSTQSVYLNHSSFSTFSHIPLPL
jgi:hypothetical protein